VARPVKLDAVTTAALYRLLDATHPTMMIDEADNLGLALRDTGRLRAVLNSGHRQGGMLAITVKDHVRWFSVFSPLALALPDMFGELPRTLNERCITISLERSDGGRKLKRFDAVHPDPALNAAYLQILIWQREAKLNPDPEMPARNRWADNWRPLISIADALGWGERAREAMAIFIRESYDADIKISLLNAIRRVFDARGVDFLWTDPLLEALHGLDGAEWCEFRGVRGDQQPHKLKSSELALMLRDFKIKPRTIWQGPRTPGNRSRKGYRREQFEQVWRAYCEDGTASQSSDVRSLRGAGDDTA
jgi:hypothetical protein